MPIDGPAIGDIAAVVADRDLLDAALRRLTPEGRAVVVLHFYLGLPLPEAAAALDIPRRDRQVPAPSRPRGHARLDHRRSATRATPSREGSRMTAFDRFEQDLPELMTELAAARVPDYLDDMLRQSARTRQRPAGAPSKGGSPWASSPEPPRAPGSLAVDRDRRAAHRPRRGRPSRCSPAHSAPAPAAVRPARNGVIATSIDGDIVTVDPVTGATRSSSAVPPATRSPCSRTSVTVLFTRTASGSAPGPVDGERRRIQRPRRSSAGTRPSPGSTGQPSGRSDRLYERGRRRHHDADRGHDDRCGHAPGRRHGGAESDASARP